MDRKTGLILNIVTIVLCGVPGILSGLGGLFIASFGLLADMAQLKLDTNLDQSSVILTGMSGVCLGFILVAIPILVWLRTKHH
jgi:predicted ABC-type sugar transport system permease subunit